MGLAALTPNLRNAAQLLFQGAPKNPLYGDDQQQTASAAPSPSSSPAVTQLPAASSPGSDGAALLYGNPGAAKPPMSEAEFDKTNPDTTAYMPRRPVGDFDPNTPHPKLRSALGALFAGMAEFGRPGAGFAMANRWADQTAAQRAYDQDLPRMQSGALHQAYQNYLQSGAEQAGIQHTQQETRNLQANVPLLQHQQQFLDKVRQLKESGKYQSDQDLFNAVLPEASTVPGMTRQMISDAINSSKALGPQFSVQADKGGRPEYVQTRTGQRIYPDANGKFADPQMQQIWDSEMQAHQQSLGEEENKEKRVAGYAAERQAAAQSFQSEQERLKQAQPRVDTALDADERLSRMEKSYGKALNGDQQAQLALLSDHLGMTMGMQKGARLNKDIIQQAQQSRPWLQGLKAKFNDHGILTGVSLSPEQMRQMLDLGYEARDRAWSSAHDAYQSQGIAFPQGAAQVEGKRQAGTKPALEAQSSPAGTKKATKAHVSAYATAKGISEQQAEQEFKNAGYTIQ